MNQNKKATFLKTNYPQEKNKAKEFITGFTDNSMPLDERWGKHKYMIELVIEIK